MTCSPFRSPVSLLPPASVALLTAAVCLLLLAGCPKSNDPADDEPATESSAGSVQTVDAATLSPVGRQSDRTSPDGRWLLLMVQGGQVLPAGLVTIDPDADPPMSLSQQTRFAPDWTVESATIDGNKVDATFARPDGTVELELAMRDGRLDGAANFGRGSVTDAQLIAWDAETIDDPNISRPPPGYQRMEALRRDKESTPEQARELADLYDGTPVARELKQFALLRTLENAVKEQLITLAEAAPPADADNPPSRRNEAAAPVVRQLSMTI